MRCGPEVLLDITRAPGHPPPHLQAVVGHYASLLVAMETPGRIRHTLSEMGHPTQLIDVGAALAGI